MADPDQLRRGSRARGAAGRPAIAQEDTYLSHRLTRLRRHQRGPAAPPHRGGRTGSPIRAPESGPTKTREEIEIVVAAGGRWRGELLRLFEARDFTRRHDPQTTHAVPPDRQRHEVEVAIDQAEGLGDFAEVETLAATDADLPAAQAAVLAVAEELGLTEVEPRSYLRMTLDEWRPAAKGQLPGTESGDGDAGRRRKVRPKPASQTRRIVVKAATSRGRDVAVISFRPWSWSKSISDVDSPNGSID